MLLLLLLLAVGETITAVLFEDNLGGRSIVGCGLADDVTDEAVHLQFLIDEGETEIMGFNNRLEGRRLRADGEVSPLLLLNYSDDSHVFSTRGSCVLINLYI